MKFRDARRRTAVFGVLALVAMLAVPRASLAQFNFLRSLLGPRPATQPFAGQQQLLQARAEAERGDIAKSLALVREAMQTVKRPFPPDDPTGPMVASQLVELSRLWRTRQAPAEPVADVLRDIVLPPEASAEVRGYALPWGAEFQPWSAVASGARLAPPQSVAGELVDWAIRARQIKPLRQRLETLLAAPQPNSVAFGLAAELAVAEGDYVVANRCLRTLQTAVTDGAAPAPPLTTSLQAVAAAVRASETEAAGLSLLEAVLEKTTAADNPGPFDQPIVLNWLRLQAAQRHVRAGRIDDGVRLAIAAANRPVLDPRYGGDFGEYLQRMQVAQAITVLLDAGRVADALERLGPWADAPESRYTQYYAMPNVAARLSRELQKLPPADRFELLKAWVLPAGDRTTLRDLTDFVPAAPPAELALVDVPAAGLLQDVYSTGWDLLRTARELGQLEALLQDLAVIVPSSPSLETLRTLGAVMRDGTSGRSDGVTVQPGAAHGRLQALLLATEQSVSAANVEPRPPFPMLTYVVAAEAARHPEWSSLAESLLQRLIEFTQRIQWDRPRNHVRLTWAEVQRRQSDPAGLAPQGAAQVAAAWQSLQPRHWIEAGHESAGQHASGSLPGVWVAHDDYIQHLVGAYDSLLCFAFPLAGEFEVSFERREGGWAEGGAGYGGAQFAVNAYADQAGLHGVGRLGYVSGPNMANLLNRTPWNRQNIQVADGVVRYFVNGQLVHEDRPGESSPWFVLEADWGRTPIYRNLQVTGTPIIPQEVNLLTDVRLRGWVTVATGESRRDPLAEPGPDGTGQRVVLSNGVVATATDPDTDWTFRDGELQSLRRTTFWPGVVESHIAYHRPLRPGETLTYEFFHREGEIEAHPLVGRRAFVLGTHGVTVRGLTDGDFDVHGLRSDNGLLHARPLPLQEDDWNRMTVAMHADRVEFRINGEAAFEQPLAAVESREFGFYHDAGRTSLRVRHAVLRGDDWPRSFTETERSAIERPQPANPPAQQQFLADIVTEPLLADNAYAVYRRALALDAAARYDLLYRWVMPGDTHRSLRLAGAFTPTHPSPPALAENPIDVATAEARQLGAARRVQTGGSFVCPAILLVFTAAELNRLDELFDAVFRVDAGSGPGIARARSALLGIIALLQDHPDEALSAIWESARLLRDSPPGPQHDRWSELALCSLAMLHPVTREASYELLDRLRRRQVQAGQPGSPEFSRYARHLHGQVHYLLYGGDPATFGAAPPLKQWHVTTQSCASARGAGHPPGAFDLLGHELALRGGHELDMAYFQSPLRGNYEVRARLSQFDWREMMPFAAGISNVVKYTQDAVKLQGLRTAVRELPTPALIAPPVRGWADYRVVVQDGRYACYVNDQMVYETVLSPNADPWVAIVGWVGHSTRAARNVVITGQPEIPDELDLLAGPDLASWFADYYGAATGQSPYPWRLEDGVLMCDQAAIRGDSPRRLKVENLIRYHRPMMEDGEITYDFYYDPETRVPEPREGQFVEGFVGGQPAPTVAGQTLVHPALDRMVCLLEPDGVKIHWLTDGRYDRTGLSAGNVTAEPNRGPPELPLLPRAWNSVRVQVAGDTLTIVLNGEPVFERTIEPTNQRQFGLFHYVNESNVRVRNVRYRGDWPKTLPPVEEQELAGGPERMAEIPAAELPARADFDFTGGQFDPQAFAYHWNAQAANYVHPSDQGLRITMPAGESKPQVAGVHPRLRLVGDFVVTLDYANLVTVPPQESWGSGLSFKVQLDNSYEAGFEVRQWQKSTATTAMWQIRTPLGEHVYYSENDGAFPPSGRLRLVRRGGVLYFLTADTGGEEFRLLTQRPVGTSDVKAVNVQADSSDQAAGADVTLKHLSIRASQILPVK